MTFEEILAQVREQLQREGRVAYRILRRRFDLSDDDLEDLKADLIDAKRVAADEDGKVLVWTGATMKQEPETRGIGESEPRQTTSTVDSQTDRLRDSRRAEGERRQLTVMFCDLVGSTALSQQLDPEELREVIQAYRETCATVIRRFDGYLAKYIGDGLLVYFGYPVAHEDDAQRAVRTGLEIIAALQHPLPFRHGGPSPLAGGGQGEGAKISAVHTPHPNLLPPGGKELRRLQVRIGIHTGLVVAGEMGTVDQPEHLAIVGETPNIAARLQDKAAPNGVVISPTTYRLVTGLFECEELGPYELKGIMQPLALYQVVRESTAQSRFEVAVGTGLTPLVGREEELGLLRRRWEQAKEGAGQVVLLSGEPGIGKSRLVEALKEIVEREGARCLELRCSPYAQNSALQPVIEHLQRTLHFRPEETAEEKLRKLEAAFVGVTHASLLHEHVPLFAALLSLPHPEGYPPLTFSPQKQKEKTTETLVAWLGAEAKQHAVTYAWEDLHWADPSTLELLTLYLEQIPTTRIFTVLTFRPDFTPPWGPRSYLMQLTLSRLERSQVEMMIEQVAAGKPLPAEVVEQIVAKTDGVPLFVEELTKMVVETMGEWATGNGQQEEKHVGVSPVVSAFHLGVPSTLQDALMARLDRLGPAKEIAQVGATLGREFSYELLHAVSPSAEAALQQGLRQLVEAELIYQRGLPPRATYLFKHALIQDTAYQSLLKSRRQQLHQQIAQVLAERFPETTQTQPELLAHHYTEAGLIAQALPHWQRAGERASQRSAYVEAIGHLTRGLEVLKTLPDTPERLQQELLLQTTLGPVLIATKGYAAEETGAIYTRARELCRQVGETLLLFRVLFGLWAFYIVRAEHKTAYSLGEQLLSLAESQQDTALLVEAHWALGASSFALGEVTSARAHLERSIALYDPHGHRPLAFLYGYDPGMSSETIGAWVLWSLGYPDQALTMSQKSITLAQQLSHPFSLAYALGHAARLHQFRREEHAVQERTEAAMALSTEQGFPFFLTQGVIFRGVVLAEQGWGHEGITQIQQGIAAFRATGAELYRPYFLTLLAEAYEKAEQGEKGLAVLAEALAVVDNTGERFYEAELYRLKGTLTLQSQASPKQVSGKSQASQDKAEVEHEAEACFLKALEVARKQQAKSLELRAVMSLARLWQQQGKRTEAHQLLSDVYHWFTEGFDTKDLQEAKALLEELGQ